MIRDYIYFLVDGIYPKWPIFISTILDTTPGSKDKRFAAYQEAVRKDIEQAFGVIVKKFDILSRSIPLSLFGSLQIAPDGSIVQEAIGSRLHQIDAALHNELEHYGLMYDLREHIWNKSNNSNAI